jgi:hypothetical protein
MNSKPIFIAILMLIQLLDYSQSTCIKRPVFNPSLCEECSKTHTIARARVDENLPLLYLGQYFNLFKMK